MPSNNAPITFMHGPCTAYIAPYGSGGTLPEIGGDPDAYSWSGGVKLGQAGKEDIGTGGVSISKLTTFNEIRTDGTTGPVKALIDTETFEVTFTIHDISQAGNVMQLMFGANKFSADINTAAGSSTAGFRSVFIGDESGEPKLWNLLIGFQSSSNLAGGFAQLNIKKCYIANDPTMVFNRGEVAGVEFTFRALQDTSASANQQFGLWKVQTAVATG